MKRIALECNGEDFSYYLIRKKNIKNLNMRIKEDLNIYISVPYRIGEDFVTEFVAQNTQRIKMARLKLAEANVARAEKRARRKDIFIYLGRAYKKVFILDSSNAVAIEGDKVYVYGKSALKVDSILDSFVREQAVLLIYDMLDELGYVLKAVGLKDKPEIKLRKMKARWGSCHYTKNKIVLNTELFCHDRECIRYVLLHELCHFREPNHSYSFYRLLESFMPEWREVKERLNKGL